MSAGTLEGRASIYGSGAAYDLAIPYEDPSTHAWARDVVTQALAANGLGSPSLSMLQAAQAVGYRESSYGRGWKDDGQGSHNWGAVQAGRPPCGEGTFLYTDTHPESDGSSTPYQICFRAYPTDVDGAADMVRHLFIKRPGVLAAARSGSLEAFSAAMYDEHYYEGFGATREARIKNHMKWIKGALDKIAPALGEPVALGEGGGIVGGGGGSGWLLAGAAIGLGLVVVSKRGR